MNSSESSPLFPEDNLVESCEQYAALLKKAAAHLLRIAEHPAVNDPSLVSAPVRHIIDTPSEDLVVELGRDLWPAEDDEDGFFYGPALL